MPDGSPSLFDPACAMCNHSMSEHVPDGECMSCECDGWTNDASDLWEWLLS